MTRMLINKKFPYVYYILFFILITCSCNSNSTRGIDNKLIVGSWIFNIDDDQFNGIDIIILNDDNSFEERKSFDYSDTDNDFIFNIQANLSIGGQWSLRADSLILSYDKKSLNVEFNNDTFCVAPTFDDSNITIAQDIKDSMRNDLCVFLDTTLRNSYNGLPQQISIGKIETISTSSMIISNKTEKIELTRK